MQLDGMERTFGEAKEQHGLRRCRSRGLDRFAVQGFLTAIVLNLKRMVAILMADQACTRITAPSAA